MRIEGAGGCFDDRVYEVDRALCWKIVKLSINEMGPMGDVIDDVDEERCIVKFHGKDKHMQVAVQPIDEETMHVIMDATKARLQIYSWKKETEEVEQAFPRIFYFKNGQHIANSKCPNNIYLKKFKKTIEKYN